MEILLVAEDDSYRNHLRPFFQPRGCRIIHYRNPLKAMDNLPEIDPEVILFCAFDFPRHWKLMLQSLRKRRPKEEAVFVLIQNRDFEVDEADKAMYLGANGIVYSEDLSSQSFGALENLLNRYHLLPAVGSTASVIPQQEETINLVFGHPDSGRLVTGIITALSLYEAAFRPDSPPEVLDLESGTAIHNATLKIQDQMITLSAQVVLNQGKVLTLRILSFQDQGDKQIENYLIQRAGGSR